MAAKTWQAHKEEGNHEYNSGSALKAAAAYTHAIKVFEGADADLAVLHRRATCCGAALPPWRGACRSDRCGLASGPLPAFAAHAPHSAAHSLLAHVVRLQGRAVSRVPRRTRLR